MVCRLEHEFREDTGEMAAKEDWPDPDVLHLRIKSGDFTRLQG